MTFKTFISKYETNFEERHLGFGPEYQEVEAVKIDNIDLIKIETLINSKTESLKTLFRDAVSLREYDRIGVMNNISKASFCYFPVVCTFYDYQISINFGDYLVWCKDAKRFVVLPEFEFNLFYRRK